MHLMNKLGVIYLHWTRLLKQQLVPHKITLKQQFVLKQLRDTDFLYPHQIANILYADRPTTSVIIKNMERNGWISKVKDKSNMKQFKISITEDGLEKLFSMKGTCGKQDMERFDPLKCLSPTERQTLDIIISKVLENL